MDSKCIIVSKQLRPMRITRLVKGIGRSLLRELTNVGEKDDRLGFWHGNSHVCEEVGSVREKSSRTEVYAFVKKFQTISKSK